MRALIATALLSSAVGFTPQIYCPDHTTVPVGESCPMQIYRVLPTPTETPEPNDR